jgi:hypothetical protein
MSKKNNTLEKCDALIKKLEGLKKALGDVNVQPKRNPVNALGVGWSQDPSTGSFHHSTHGIITTTPHPEGGFQIMHGGGMVGRVNSLADAGARIKQHVGSLGPLETNNYNRSSPNLPTTPKMAKPAYKSEDEEEDVEKSGYGPKGGSQYTIADNAKRKANNMDEISGIGPNKNAKSYSSKPGQLSAKQQAAKAPSGAAGPVKQYTPAQIAAINEARKLKKNAEENAWVQHAPVPNGDEEVQRLRKTNPVEVSENLMANQLANLMQGRAMLGTPPPRQPTDQEMFGHLVTSEEQIAKAEHEWNNKLNWLEEATKPISSRFDSPEAEEAYWAGIKVADRDDGKSGY